MQTSKYVRAAATTVAVFEYIRTIPTVVDFYLAQWERRKISTALVLFILIRITSILAVVFGDVNSYITTFSEAGCHAVFLTARIIKILQIMVSQCIMGVRTSNLSGRSKVVGSFLLGLYLGVTVIQFYVLFHGLSIFIAPVIGLCTAKLPSSGLTFWVFYLVAIIYDCTVIGISTYYIWRYKQLPGISSTINRVMDAMLVEGMIYFVLLTAVNVVNLVITKSGSAVGGYSATMPSLVAIWLLSQYIVLDQYRAQKRISSELYVSGDDLGHSVRSTDESRELRFAPRDMHATESPTEMHAIQGTSNGDDAQQAPEHEGPQP